MTLASRVLGLLAHLPPATTPDVSVERDLQALMPDGTVLLADRWYPARRDGRWPPVILLRTPYGRRQWAGVIGRLFAERGFQAVIQSCRGTFGSGGEWVPFRNEEADGKSTLEWISQQSWFAGELATFGPSYLGLTQWAVAQDPPEYLRAMALDVTASDFRRAVVYPSDCLALGTSLAWMRQLEFQERGPWRSLRAQLNSRRALVEAGKVLPPSDADVVAAGRHVPFFQDWLAHEDPDDSWWDPINFGHRLGRVPPASLVGGWYDIFLPFQLADYQALRAAGRDARLTVGPWTHTSPGTIAASLRDGLEWFDVHLGDPPESDQRPPVRIFVMGTRRWISLPDWPPPADEQLWYLGERGTLGPSPSDGPPDHYRYDPADPTPAVGGPSLDWSDSGAKDQHIREVRADVLTYTSAFLPEDLTVIGPLSVDLHVRSSLGYCDFFVRICDVSPRGRSRNVSDGIVRLTPGAPATSADGSLSVRIHMGPTANTFARGHRVRLQVSSGAHPLFMRNTGTGEPLRYATQLRMAEQAVLHDAEHPSVLRLAVART
jgi:putative CocE/NonD family hydrolase